MNAKQVKLRDPAGLVLYAEFSPDSRLIVTAGDGRSARLWDPRTGNLLAKPMLHAKAVLAARFAPRTQYLVTASMDETARIWKVDGRHLGSPIYHQGLVNSARFSPDGLRVVTASDDCRARVWDARTAQPLSPWLSHDSWVTDASFSPDGMRVLTVTETGARIWNLGAPPSSTVPDWFPAFLEAVGGLRLDAAGALEAADTLAADILRNLPTDAASTPAPIAPYYALLQRYRDRFERASGRTETPFATATSHP